MTPPHAFSRYLPPMTPATRSRPAHRIRVVAVGSDPGTSRLADRLWRDGHDVSVFDPALLDFGNAASAFRPAQLILLSQSTRTDDGVARLEPALAQFSRLAPLLSADTVILLRGIFAAGTGQFLREWLDVRGFRTLRLALLPEALPRGGDVMGAHRHVQLVGCDGPDARRRIEQVLFPPGRAIESADPVFTNLYTAELVSHLLESMEGLMHDLLREMTALADRTHFDESVLRRVLLQSLEPFAAVPVADRSARTA